MVRVFIILDDHLYYNYRDSPGARLIEKNWPFRVLKQLSLILLAKININNYCDV